MCSEHSSEDNLESVANKLPTKEFIIPQGTQYIYSQSVLFFSFFLASSLGLHVAPMYIWGRGYFFFVSLPLPCTAYSFLILSLLHADVTSHLQGHCHWLVEMAVKVVSAITKATTDAVSKAVILIT